MVFLIGIGAAVALAFGWVLQQRMAARAARARPLSKRLLLEVMRRPLWWGASRRWCSARSSAAGRCGWEQ